MATLTNLTFKSVSASIGLHALFIVLGSWAFYNNSIQTLELTGNGGGKRTISLSGLNFNAKKSIAQAVPVRNVSKAVEKTIATKTTVTAITTDTVSVTNGAVSAAVTGGQGLNGSGDASGSGNGSGTGSGDFDHGYLFGQIKNFFETRLGSTLNIRENQLIKIKVTLNKEGEILDAILVQGKLDMNVLRRVISVAKNIPLKSYWKAATYPQELIIPLILTPS
jgi:hypothetical protein